MCRSQVQERYKSSELSKGTFDPCQIALWVEVDSINWIKPHAEWRTLSGSPGSESGRFALSQHQAFGHFRPRSRPSAEPIYSMRMPEIARAITSCWISLVPSKIVWILASRCQRSTGYSRV